MKVNKTDQQAVKEYFDSASEKHQRGNILNSELMTKKISRKERYKLHCEQEKSISIFSQSWWLDCVASKDAWDVCLVEKGGHIVASMPYVIKNKIGIKICTMPTITQSLGPWIKPSKAKYSQQLSQQKFLMNQLIRQLPDFDYFLQNWHYSQTNWLPFYWQGFKQSNSFTYVIEDLSDLNKVWLGFRENIRRDIRKASNRFNLIVDDSLSVMDFMELNKKVFMRQNKTASYSEEFVQKLDQSCVENASRKIFIAIDEHGRKHAGVYLVWDKDCAYYLLGGGDPDLRNSGATSLCMWEAIKFASTVVNKFDFEGSMIEPIERFVRAFGAKQKPYHTITKTPSLILRIRAAFMQLHE